MIIKQFNVFVNKILFHVNLTKKNQLYRRVLRQFTNFIKYDVNL